MSGEDGAVAGAVRVLVVDDDESFRAAVGAMLLDDERFVVVGSVVSGEAAIDVAASTVCDLVVMDVRMPGLGGPAAAGELQRRQPDLVIVLVSTGDVSEREMRGIGGTFVPKIELDREALARAWAARGAGPEGGER